MSQLLEFVKGYPGVQLRGDSLAIDFRFQGVRCRETLKNMAATKANIKWAYNKRTVILHEIAQGTFNYRSHFPDSKKADLFAPVQQVPTVNEALDVWLKTKESSLAPKTWRGYQGIADNRLRPKFGHRTLDSILQSEIKTWRVRDLGELSNKTINDIMTPLRGIFEDALADRIIEFNPLTHVKNLERDSEDNADPFGMAELDIISATETTRESERNGFLFACWSGLRISEWLSLAWEDVDFNKREVSVRRSVVRGDYKVPKTRGSVRTVHLLDQAWDILLQQKALTFMQRPQTVEVTQADKRRKKKEKLTFIFTDTFTHEPYINSARVSERFFESFLKKLGIRYRGPNQARHTYASQLLTKGVAERWIMREMGHTSIQMFEKHYGRWMDSEMPGMAETVSKMFQMVTSRSQDKTKIM
ncbi:site-specific integrase [Salinimonas marina]|uniref:Site-specific integrase n=1 Tax=Salinimonas marina TaxID=2785918 RepID=A0A7S9DZS1_9ALTE|nr:DUF3596 domain-containing protein [Salinimonas marina]QPG06923.1 site-specific integrase [Salinimonas marina]